VVAQAKRRKTGLNNFRQGMLAESLAVWALRLKGYQIVGRRIRQKKGTGAGEIDIVARRGWTLAFVEVKRRASVADGLAAVSPSQQQRLCRAAEWFLKTNTQYQDFSLRFDVMVVAPRRWPTHVQNAWGMGA